MSRILAKTLIGYEICETLEDVYPGDLLVLDRDKVESAEWRIGGFIYGTVRSRIDVPFGGMLVWRVREEA